MLAKENMRKEEEIGVIRVTVKAEEKLKKIRRTTKRIGGISI